MQTELLSPPHPATPQPERTLGYVLIVDDEEVNRLLLRDPLEALGYEIAEAENGNEALRVITRRRPDVILLDVMMPDLDGFQLCRRLKDDRRTAHIPVLLVTALSERKERLLGMQAGANDFLNKPVDIPDLILRVGNAVHAKSLFDQLQVERQKSEGLLRNMLPQLIVDRMKKGEVNIADRHPDVTVLVADLVGFSAMAAHIPAEQIVSLLNEVFSEFDLLVEGHGLEKIKTIGDAYMVAGGIPLPQPGHPEAVAGLALAMIAAVKRFDHDYNTTIGIRIGINTGPVVAGVIGRRKFAYDLWGDTVNIACRLESLGQAGEIRVSEATHQRLTAKYEFNGPITSEMRGRSALVTYSLLSHRPNP
jgi:adenylate cyclase